MNYEQFQNEILKKVKAGLIAGTNAQPGQIEKNNGVVCRGITLELPQSKNQIAISLEDYFEDFKQGRSINEIADCILEIERQTPTNLIVDNFLDFDTVKDNILFKLINYKKNEDQLKAMPYLPFLDLAIVFYIALEIGENGIASILIHNDHLKLWEVDAETLWSYAQRNAPSLLPPKILSMADILKRCPQESRPGEFPNCLLEYFSSGIFALSNHYECQGSSVVLYPGILKKLGDTFQENYFLIPSSVHEFLIYMEDIGVPKEVFTEWISSINETEVNPQEVLSDHPYYYERELDKLIIP